MTAHPRHWLHQMPWRELLAEGGASRGSNTIDANHQQVHWLGRFLFANRCRLLCGVHAVRAIAPLINVSTATCTRWAIHSTFWLV